MMNMVKVFRHLFGPWVASAPQRPSFKPVLEGLEERCCPSTTWAPQALQGGGYSTNGNNAANYTNGLPSATNPLVLDGSKTQLDQPITFNNSINIGSLTAQNNYQSTLTISPQAIVSTTANDTVNGNCTLTIVSGSPAGIQLQNSNNVFTVAAGGTLNLADPIGNKTPGNAFITATPGTQGDYLNNSGTVKWTGTAVASGQTALFDYLFLPVLNNGTFTADGGTNGNTSAVGAQLYINGTSGNTHNMSFYQTAGSLNLQNSATVRVSQGLYQTAGSLNTLDSSVCTLKSGGSGNGDLNIAAGKVVVDTSTTSTGTLKFIAGTVELNAEVDVSGFTLGGGSTKCDLLDCGTTPVTLGANSFLNVGTKGTQPLGTGNQWTVMKYGGIQNKWGKVVVPPTMKASTGLSSVLVSN